MKSILTTAAVDLNNLAEAEGVLAVVILADGKSQAIEVYSLAQVAAQREALERALNLLNPRKATN